MLFFSRSKKKQICEKPKTLKDVRKTKSVSFILFSHPYHVTLEKGDSQEKAQICEAFYNNVVKTQMRPYTFINCQTGKKYVWTGRKEEIYDLALEENPVDWDIVIMALTALMERGELTKKQQHAYVHKLLKQKDCGTGCEKLTMNGYLEKLKDLDKEIYKIPINDKNISKYEPQNNHISDWSVSYGNLAKAQQFAYSFLEEYKRIYDEMK